MAGESSPAMHRSVCVLLCALWLVKDPSAARIANNPGNCNGTDCPSSRRNDLEQHPNCSNSTTTFGNTTTLHLRSENLTALPRACQLNPSIVDLDVSGNRIENTTDELRSLGELRELTVENNLLVSLSFLPDPCNLERLLAFRNHIKNLKGPLRRCTKMLVLDLKGNVLRTLPSGIFVGMANLSSLSLADNPLRSLEPDTFRALVQLKDLDLSNTSLGVIPDTLFSGLLDLEFLSLQHNQLRIFAASHLDDLNALKHLSVRFNRLTELPVMQNRCQSLQNAEFGWNNIQAVNEAAVRSFLRCGQVELYLRPTRLRAQSLRWLLGANDLERYVDDGRCDCGGVRAGGARVEWCVTTTPPTGDQNQTHAECVVEWVEAVRAAA